VRERVTYRDAKPLISLPVLLPVPELLVLPLLSVPLPLLLLLLPLLSLLLPPQLPLPPPLLPLPPLVVVGSGRVTDSGSCSGSGRGFSGISGGCECCSSSNGRSLVVEMVLVVVVVVLVVVVRVLL